jgi:hypothetical protein
MGLLISQNTLLNRSSNAPHGDIEKRSFRVIHPYHPLFQQEFELLSCRQNWGEDRVWFHDRAGVLRSIPTNWTDADGIDAFIVVAGGRSLFRIPDLLELMQRIRVSRFDNHVRPAEARTRSGRIVEATSERAVTQDLTAS